MQSRVKTPKNVVVVTHTFFYGASEALFDYLEKKSVPMLWYIGHPLRPEQPMGASRRYINGKLMSESSWRVWMSGSLFSYATDMMRTFLLILKYSGPIELFIGINPLNAFCGIMLRKFKRVDRVVFYAIDFVPKRFSLSIVNTLYHCLESYVVRNADICWNVSPKIAEGREKYLGIDSKKYRQQVVPIGIWQKDIASHIKRTNHNRIIFVGHLLEKQGVQVVLHALPKVIRYIPDVTFTLIGGGEYENPLRALSRALRLGSHVKFFGWEPRQEVIRNKLLQSDIAVAVYSSEGEKDTNFTYYADPTKIKTYLSCGLPVVLTPVPYNAKELERKGAAYLIKYTEEDVSKMLISLLTDSEKLRKAKQSALACVRAYTWERIFSTAFNLL